jgi:hypothetical protein
MDYNLYMKKPWRNPVKEVPPKPETLAIEGDFEKFTSDMKRLFQTPKTEKQKPTSDSVSRVPAS